MQVVTAVFLKPGVPQPSYAVLIRWAGVATSAGSTDMKLKWTYTRVFRLVWILNSDSGIITMAVLLKKSKIFHCRIGAMMEERPRTGPTYRFTL